MSVSSTTNRTSYSGNGATTSFTFAQKVLASADLKVLLVDNTTKVATTQVLTTNYTVSNAGASYSSATVAMLVAPPTGTTLVIINDLSPTQGNNLVENDLGSAETQETAFDKLTLLVQRLKSRLDRAVMLPDGFYGTFDPTLPDAPTADATLTFNASGTGLALGPTPAQLSQASADVSTVAASVTAAANSAIAAAASAVTAAASATTAAGSATTAGTSATNAATSATNASTSATNAAASAVTAAAAAVVVPVGGTTGQVLSKTSNTNYATGWSTVALAPTITATRASPSNITAGGGITSAGVTEEFQFVQGSGGAVTVTANPRISAGTASGQRLTLIGRSDTNTLTMANGNGLSLNGDVTLDADQIMELLWDGTNWVEISRSR